ncbi:lysophospholipid acyltransferase family protein [Rossellomorea marisflavi]|uniref:Uncharacterized protein n=1 Tax=Rossellomorea marisflavi TaxID=189381 RepID=A0A0J5SWN2_9BACI|nr:lysophospholipid acyltransferase family protein [Rossellomorea marisflavi]KMK93505.1 hypothetical protein VL03_11400 [Rossellomorea marisflavi]KML01561.1 hypothetical protein VL06_19590 [Rossellomorea marisflavi]KML33958.1 hypothetical protein VL12_06770 [Rossellomorea marisflavi]KZE45496.1 hypothetical protein AV649_04710 [Rossellomorea marisflavi]QHA36619.1 glycerol acyltransferase [Rossellomorea marisflavi]
MIEPKKSPAFQRILSGYLTFQLKKHFHRIWLDDDRQRKGQGLMLVNHSSWWDGLLVFYLNRHVVKGDSYAMMSRKGMEEYGFFRKIGAFSVDRDSSREVVASLRYAEERLKEDKTVWIFPQGDEEHVEKRPLTFFNGPGYLIGKVPEVSVVLVTFYYTFRHHQRPELFIRLKDAPPLHGGRKERTDHLRTLMETQLDRMKSEVVEEDLSSFTPWVGGFSSSSEKLQFLKGKDRMN